MAKDEHPPIDPTLPDVACLLRAQGVDPDSLKPSPLYEDHPLRSGDRVFDATTQDGRRATAFIGPAQPDGYSVGAKIDDAVTEITRQFWPPSSDASSDPGVKDVYPSTTYQDWKSHVSITDFPDGALVPPDASKGLRDIRGRAQACGKPIV